MSFVPINQQNCSINLKEKGVGVHMQSEATCGRNCMASSMDHFKAVNFNSRNYRENLNLHCVTNLRSSQFNSCTAWNEAFGSFPYTDAGSKTGRIGNVENVTNPCMGGQYASIRQCPLDYNNQLAINAWEPLRTKLYTDATKDRNLDNDSPESKINIEKLFRCCSGTTKGLDGQRECGGYWNPGGAGGDGSCRTNCKPTIISYCTDSKHPERLLTAGSLCNNWAKQNNIDNTDNDSTNLVHLAAHLKTICKYDEKPDSPEYQNISVYDYNDSCACYRPTSFYTNFMSRIREQLGDLSNLSSTVDPICMWNPCTSSELAPPTGVQLTNIRPSVGGECPATNIAVCTTEINNYLPNATDAEININTSQECGVYNNGDGDGGGGGGGDDGDDGDGDGSSDEENSLNIVWIILPIVIILMLGIGFYLYRKYR